MRIRISKLSKSTTFYIIFIGIAFLSVCSSAISQNLDDIEKFSPLSEQNMSVLTGEDNTTYFMQPDGQWGSGSRCGTLPPTEEQAEAVQRAIEEGEARALSGESDADAAELPEGDAVCEAGEVCEEEQALLSE